MYIHNYIFILEWIYINIYIYICVDFPAMFDSLPGLKISVPFVR